MACLPRDTLARTHLLSFLPGHHFDEITLELTRAIIALSVFAVGVELPRAYVWRHWKSLTMLLGPV